MSDSNQQQPVFKDPEQPLAERIKDLLDRLSLEEKVSQMLYYSSSIPGQGIPEYNWWNECLHGIARAGVAIVFPQSIAMAASFSPELIHNISSAIADEARAKYNRAIKHEDRGIYKGLTFWTPNINIFRDPRWGRGQETYGEDPYLTGRLGVAFIEGLQGDDPEYLQVAACAKHFAVHSGPENLRHEFDARVSDKDLWETYLPAFRRAIKEGEVEAVMGAYNRVNGEPASASEELLVDILRGKWDFSGHVVSDCGAIEDIYKKHKLVETAKEAAALAVNNGCDLNCGRVFEDLLQAIDEGLISEETVDRSVKRLFRTRFKLGMFDPEERVPFSEMPYEVNDSPEHRRLAREAAAKTMVLLKNEDSLLPVDLEELSSVAVIGPNADNKDVLLGNYNGLPSNYSTPLLAIQEAVGEDTRVYYSQGCDLTNTETSFWGRSPRSEFSEALTVAEKSELVIMCLGLSPALEGEEGAVAESDGGGDKKDLKLPGLQQELLETVSETGTPVVLVLFNGSPLSVNWAQENVAAILEAWYPGQDGGRALVDILTGKENPAGRSPLTFVRSVSQLPKFTDYSMVNRTYRYFESQPLYPFGYGLSYTDFEYRDLQLSSERIQAGEELKVTVDVTNTGSRSGDEVVQLYLSDLEASVRVPERELKGVERISLRPDEEKTVSFVLTPEDMSLVNEKGEMVLEPGDFILTVGGQQPDERSTELTGERPLRVEFTVTGEEINLGY
ncbi:MAG: glycoside hydrolase family 3 C-terminal domain-containing protein [Halanaerobiales bacterium]